MNNLGKLKRMEQDAPEAMKAFWSFDKAAFAPGAIDGLRKQLMLSLSISRHSARTASNSA